MHKMLDRAYKIQEILAKQRKLYAELDEITTKLSKLKRLHSSKYDVCVRDNFAEKNVAFRTTSIHRYELIIQRKK